MSGITITELMDKLGVGYALGPYETFPWSSYDPAQGLTCSAEVRMSPESNEVEAEAQFLYDTPPEGKNSMEQICHIRAIPGNADGLWSVVSLRLRGEPYGEGIYNWQMKCCDFFAMLTRALAANEMPDIDELIEDAFHGGERFYDQHGGGGGRAPKIRPSKLLGLKKGRGF